jgi:hypothetical protein
MDRRGGEGKPGKAAAGFFAEGEGREARRSSFPMLRLLDDEQSLQIR